MIRGRRREIKLKWWGGRTETFRSEESIKTEVNKVGTLADVN